MIYRIAIYRYENPELTRGGGKMSNLKPCPFCGSTDIDSEPNTDTYGSVCCNKCGFGSPYGEISIMIEHWNSRPLEDALRASIAELEKRATRLAQEYCELAEVWQKHECNPAPPEEVSNET
jgi:Lar family restriction alleviation protein